MGNTLDWKRNKKEQTKFFKSSKKLDFKLIY